MYCVYLLLSTPRLSTYVGFTKTAGVLDRLAKHNNGTGARQTAGQTWMLILHVPEIPTLRQAKKLEHQIHRPWELLGTAAGVGSPAANAWLPKRLMILAVIWALGQWEEPCLAYWHSPASVQALDMLFTTAKLRHRHTLVASGRTYTLDSSSSSDTDSSILQIENTQKGFRAPEGRPD